MFYFSLCVFIDASVFIMDFQIKVLEMLPDRLENCGSQKYLESLKNFQESQI